MPVADDGGCIKSLSCPTRGQMPVDALFLMTSGVVVRPIL